MLSFLVEERFLSFALPKISWKWPSLSIFSDKQQMHSRNSILRSRSLWCLWGCICEYALWVTSSGVLLTDKEEEVARINWRALRYIWEMWLIPHKRGIASHLNGFAQWSHWMTQSSLYDTPSKMGTFLFESISFCHYWRLFFTRKLILVDSSYEEIECNMKVLYKLLPSHSFVWLHSPFLDINTVFRCKICYSCPSLQTVFQWTQNEKQQTGQASRLRETFCQIAFFCTFEWTPLFTSGLS